MSEEKKKGGLIKGLIIGGAIGSVMSMLLNTKKGQKCKNNFTEGLGKKLSKCFKKDNEL